MQRVSSYVADFVKASFRLTSKEPTKIYEKYKIIKNDSFSAVAPFRVVNIGNSNPINLLYFIKELENILGKEAKKNFLTMQDGDVEKTYSDTSLLRDLTGFEPITNIHEGIYQFVKWYKSSY